MERRPEDLDDAELVRVILDGDARALEEVYARHGAAVYGLARRVLADNERAEDVVQEVFLRLWNQPERFDPQRGALRSFLNRETHSRAIERRRSDSARYAREERHDRERVEPAYDLEAAALDTIRSESMRSAIAELSDGERAAIAMAYFGGRTYREVAIELGQPEGTIRSRIRLGLNKLAGKLEASGMRATP
jgi:RNA polymerase sigma-70 factor, ECF subfamily